MYGLKTVTENQPLKSNRSLDWHEKTLTLSKIFKADDLISSARKVPARMSEPAKNLGNSEFESTCAISGTEVSNSLTALHLPKNGSSLCSSSLLKSSRSSPLLSSANFSSLSTCKFEQILNSYHRMSPESLRKFKKQLTTKN